MKRILEEIVSEEFAEEWRKESGIGIKFRICIARVKKPQDFTRLTQEMGVSRGGINYLI